MPLEITPEPTEEEREAIAVALEEPESPENAGPWRDDPAEP